jgi:hypothetical protein
MDTPIILFTVVSCVVSFLIGLGVGQMKAWTAAEEMFDRYTEIIKKYREMLGLQGE